MIVFAERTVTLKMPTCKLLFSCLVFSTLLLGGGCSPSTADDLKLLVQQQQQQQQKAGNGNDGQNYVQDQQMMMAPGDFSGASRGQKCQAGEVFCFEQMACILPKGNQAALDNRRQADIWQSPVQSCKPNEIYCFETGRCRLRPKSPNAKPTNATGPKKRRVTVSGNATFLADFNVVFKVSSRLDKFKGSFVNGLAAYLKVPLSSVIVKGVRSGSIIVEFSASANSTVSYAADSVLVAEFQTQVANGLDTIVVDAGDNYTMTVSSYRLIGSVETDSDWGGGSTTVSSAGSGSSSGIGSLPFWVWIIVGVGGLLLILFFVLIIYCCCVKKKNEKVVPSYNGEKNRAMIMGQPPQPVQRQPTAMVPTDDSIFGSAGYDAKPIHAELVASPAASARQVVVSPKQTSI